MKNLNYLITAFSYLIFAVLVQTYSCNTSSMAIGLCGAGKILMQISLLVLFLVYLVISKLFKRHPVRIAVVFIAIPPIVWFLL